jgi:hypothetical protein
LPTSPILKLHAAYSTFSSETEAVHPFFYADDGGNIFPTSILKMEAYIPPSAMKTEVLYSTSYPENGNWFYPETLVVIYQTVSRHIPEALRSHIIPHRNMSLDYAIVIDAHNPALCLYIQCHEIFTELTAQQDAAGISIQIVSYM